MIAQVFDVPRKPEKRLNTREVDTFFSSFLYTAVTDTLKRIPISGLGYMKSLLLVAFLSFSFPLFSESYRDLSLEKLIENAESDDEVAMSFLAENYEKGRGVEKNINNAFKWYKKAAELNYAPAQYNLAVLLQKSDGTKQDFAQAYFWVEKAAEQNYAPAQFLIGSFFAQGIGTYSNKKLAAEWYKRAAEQENTTAQYNLALMLLQGDGVKKDEIQGMQWMQKAANNHHAQAISVLNLIKNQK